MREKIRFPSPEEQKEREIVETLKVERGILYFEETDPETKEKRSYVNILGVKLETYASKEDIEAIKEKIVLSELDQEMLRTIAERYKLRQPLMFEGDPGAGKTFLLKKFVQLIHGKEAPVLILTGSPRTTDFEIMGHWAPKAEQRESQDSKVGDAIKRYDEVENSYRDLTDEFDRKYKQIQDDFGEEKINKEKADRQVEKLVEWFEPLQKRYTSELQALIQRTTLTKTVEWEFQRGPLLQAYSDRGGKGYILIVDEFNLIPTNYQQTFLQIGGEEGALSESINYWGDTDKVIYPRGKDTWICFASNFPEKTPGRSEVVGPMTDRLAWETISPEETEKKKRIIAETCGGLEFTKESIKELRKTFGKSISFEAETALEIIPEITVERPLEIKKNFLLHVLLNHTLALLDTEFTEYYQKAGDRFAKEGRRIQQFEFSGRNPLSAFSYLNHFQFRNPETGLIDFTKTLERAFKACYLKILVDPEGREKMRESFREILGLNITPRELEALRESEETLKAGGKKLPPGVVLFEGEIRTRKEVLDILVKRASLTEEEKGKKEEEREREIERRTEQLEFDIEDELGEMFEDPTISESVKEILQQKKG